MDEPRPPFPLVTRLLLLALFLVVAGTTAREYWKYRQGKTEADERVRIRAVENEEKLAPATSLQVWAAGYRGSDGKFCSPCTPNPTLLLEISDPADVREFLSKFRYRRRVPDEDEVAICGTITIDFLRDQRILHSCNLKPMRLEDESWRFVQGWLTKRDLLNKADAARYRSPAAPKRDR